MNCTPDHNGHTPLHDVASYGHQPVVKLLLERGADPNKRNNRGDTPLHFAVKEGHKVVAQTLIKSFAKTDVANNDGQTPLTLAHGRKEMLDILNGTGPR